MSIVSTVTGKIFEFEDKAIRLTLENPEQPNTKYVLTVCPSTLDGVMNVRHAGNTYCATPEQAKQHILDAISIASLSLYASNHTLTLTVPFYPSIIIRLTDLPTMKPILMQALDNCM